MRGNNSILKSALFGRLYGVIKTTITILAEDDNFLSIALTIRLSCHYLDNLEKHFLRNHCQLQPQVRKFVYLFTISSKFHHMPTLRTQVRKIFVCLIVRFVCLFMLWSVSAIV